VLMLTYGPLVLVPAIWGWDAPSQGKQSADAAVPPGYIPASLPPGIPAIKLVSPADAGSFVQLPLCPPEQPLPEWSYFDDGPGAPTWVEGASVMVNLKFPGGNVRRCVSRDVLQYIVPVAVRDAGRVSGR